MFRDNPFMDRFQVEFQVKFDKEDPSHAIKVNPWFGKSCRCLEAALQK